MFYFYRPIADMSMKIDEICTYQPQPKTHSLNFNGIIRSIKNITATVKNKAAKIISYNSHGLTFSVPKINEYSSDSILFVQEHMCTNETLFKGSLINKNLKVYFNPAKKSRGRGRPSMGIAYILSRDIKCKCIFENNRIGTLVTGNLAIIGVYMIYEDASKPQNEEDFVNSLEITKRLYTNYYEDEYEIIIMGDFNTDLTNAKSLFTQHLKNFMFELNLTSLSYLKEQIVNYTFIPEQKHIDHVLANINLTKNIETTIVYDEDNQSDHYALQTDLLINERAYNRNQHTNKANVTVPASKLQEWSFKKLVQDNMHDFLVGTLDKLENYYNSSDKSRDRIRKKYTHSSFVTSFRFQESDCHSAQKVKYFNNYNNIIFPHLYMCA